VGTYFFAARVISSKYTKTGYIYKNVSSSPNLCGDLQRFATSLGATI
jgi:hypothetical protein